MKKIEKNPKKFEKFEKNGKIEKNWKIWRTKNDVCSRLTPTLTPTLKTMDDKNVLPPVWFSKRLIGSLQEFLWFFHKIYRIWSSFFLEEFWFFHRCGALGLFTEFTGFGLSQSRNPNPNPNSLQFLRVGLRN